MFDDDDDDDAPPRKAAPAAPPVAASKKSMVATMFGDDSVDDSVGPLLKAAKPAGSASVFSDLDSPASAGGGASVAGALAAKAKAAASLFGDDDDDALLPPKKAVPAPAPAPTPAPAPAPAPTPAPAPATAPARRPSVEEPTTPTAIERRPCVPPVLPSARPALARHATESLGCTAAFVCLHYVVVQVGGRQAQSCGVGHRRATSEPGFQPGDDDGRPAAKAEAEQLHRRVGRAGGNGRRCGR